MVNQNFDKFIKYQEKEKTVYPGHGERGKNVDPKTNDRSNSHQHPGASGRDI